MECFFTNKNQSAIFTVIIVCFLLLLFSNCSKNKGDIINNTWQVESIKKHADSALTYPTTSYTFSFKNRREYVVKLDVNSCSGKVRFSGNKRVSFNSGLCTYICCDSKFAEQMIKLLEQINRYDLNDSYLILKGKNGEVINLKKI